MDDRSVGHRLLFFVSMAVIVISAFTTGYLVGRGHGGHSSDANVIAASVTLPFNASKTSHVYTKTATGGTQTITATRAMDSEELQAVRSYLQNEANKFAHGEVLQAPTADPSGNPSRGIQVRFAPIPGGGRITYETSDRNALRTLHAWIDAQASDVATHNHG